MQKLKKTYTIRDSFKDYRDKNEREETVTLKEYLNITVGFMEFIMDKLIEEGSVILPYNLGRLHVKGIIQKPKIDEDGNIKGLAIDWASTRKARKEEKDDSIKIYFTNEKTNGIRYKCAWSKKNSHVVNKYLYNLILIRKTKKRISDAVLNGKEYTIETKRYGKKD